MLDIWHHISREEIEIPSIYFPPHRGVPAGGLKLSECEFNTQEGETSGEHTARFPTVGDVTLTGGVESGASTVDEISRGSVAWVTERGATHPW